MGSAIIADIVEEHADEAAFLFRIRDAAATAPHYDGARLRELDERIDAHLDGLRVAGDEGLAIAAAALDEDEPGTAFTLTVLAAERGDAGALGAALALAEASRGAARGVVGGLAWVPFESAARGVLAPLLAQSASALHRRIGIAACAAHRQHPGEALTYALFDEDVALKTRALRAVGELGRVDLADTVRAELAHGGDARRFWAAWSAALVGVEGAVPVLWSIADSGGPFAEQACTLVMRRLEVREARARLEGLGAAADHARAAIAGASALGDPALVPWLLSSIATPALARVAGEAFATITGATIEGALAGRAPPGFSSGPSDDAADHVVAVDPDGPLAWPAEAALRAWWSARESSFHRGSRYLGGAPLTPSTLDDDVAHASQQRRAGAAIELSLRQPGRPLTEVRARVRSSR